MVLKGSSLFQCTNFTKTNIKLTFTPISTKFLNIRTINRNYSEKNSKFKSKGVKTLLNKEFDKDYHNNVYNNDNNLNLNNKLKNLLDKKKTIEKQREIMDKLFNKFKLNSVNDFLHISRKKIINGGGDLLFYYHNNIKLLLKIIYPNYPFDFANFKLKSKINYFKLIENQQKYFDKLFIKFHLKSLDDWLIIPQKLLKQKENFLIILKYYKKNFYLLLKKIYPNFPWDFETLNSNLKLNSNFNSIEKQKNFMDNLFNLFNLKSFDDWNKIKEKEIKLYGGKELLEIYQQNKLKLLTTIYPNYPWNFDEISKQKINNNNNNNNNNNSSNISNRSIKIYRKFMDDLFIKLKLKSFDDWMNIPKEKIKIIYNNHFKGDFQLLFKIIYPNFPFDFSSSQKLKNHQKITDQLYLNYQLNSLDDWLIIPRNRLGHLLSHHYKGNIFLLLSTLYPNFPWRFISNYEKKNYFLLKSIENQQKFMEELFKKLNLKSFDDWINISSVKFIQNNGRKLIENYKRDLKKLFITIYPNYPWDYPDNLREFLLKLKELIRKYQINQKKDWYRLPFEIDRKYNLFETLKLVFPSEKWKKSNFNLKGKKTTQRLLFSFTQMIYPSLLIFENYFHPKLIHSNNYELDIFIPALQLALEYQGEQHYDDIPAAFGAVESSQSRDIVKEKLAKDHSIKIIYIPYWWDQSLSSLQSSLQSS